MEQRNGEVVSTTGSEHVKKTVPHEPLQLSRSCLVTWLRKSHTRDRKLISYREPTSNIKMEKENMLLLSSVSKLPHEPWLWAESLPSGDLRHTKNRTARLIQTTKVKSKSKNETDSIFKRLKIQSHEPRLNRIALFLVTWLTSGHRRDGRHLNLSTITDVSTTLLLWN